jgi:hypothetical protein
VKAADSTGEVIRPRFDSEAADERDQAKPQLTKRTLEVWQPRTSRMLTPEDARQIVENVTGFFQALMEWNAAEQRTATQIIRTDTDAARHSTGTCPE